MFLKCSVRRKDGKEHRSWSIVESRRVSGGGVVQRHLLYLGEINDSQQAAWQKWRRYFPGTQDPIGAIDRRAKRERARTAPSGPSK